MACQGETIVGMPLASASCAAADAGRLRFDIMIDADPQGLLRLLGLLAQMGLVPELVVALREGEAMRVTIDQSGLALAQAEIIAAKMRSSVLVRTVVLDEVREDLATGQKGIS